MAAVNPTDTNHKWVECRTGTTSRDMVNQQWEDTRDICPEIQLWQEGHFLEPAVEYPVQSTYHLNLGEE
jgi:hypothetical protein